VLSRRLAETAYDMHTALEAQLQETLAELDLTQPLADALWQLDPELGAMSRRALAERLHCDPSNVTFLVDRLAERELVSRERARDDRRVQALALTPAGVRVRRRLIATLADSPLFSNLSRQEQEQLASLLERCTTAGA
jgi:DNA-binding MarR family transcriptional regulator